MIETFRRLRRLTGVYGHVRRCLKEAKAIERQHGHLPEAELNRMIMEYGRDALQRLNIRITAKGQPMQGPGLLVGNHISYVDIPLLMSQSPVNFVAKKEVRRFPVLGTGAEKAGTVFVNRGKKHSRTEASETVADSIVNGHKRVVIFPMGTTSVDEQESWRWGPFRIAAEHGIRLQPFRLRYHPLRKVAYIGDDFFPKHLWRLLDHEVIHSEIEYAEPVTITDPEAEAARWQQWAREYLHEGIAPHRRQEGSEAAASAAS